MIEEISKIVIIGAGQLGTALIRKFDSLNILSQVLIRDKKNITILENIILTEKIITDVSEINNDFDLIIIAVADGNIESICNSIAKLELNGKIIAHCSGILDKNILLPCHNNNANIVAMHPFQTFYKFTNKIFDNVGWGIDCDTEIKDIITKLIKKTNGTPVFLSEKSIQNKTLYHASAVMISNYFTTLVSSAKEMAELSGIDPKLFFPAIIDQTLSNTLDSNDFPLTGLIARGDLKNIKLQISSIENNKTLLNTYCNIGLSTLELVYHNNIISQDKYITMKKIFTLKS